MATELPPDTPVDTLIGHMVGGRMETLFPDRKPPREATVLQVRGLTRAPDVYDASFDLREGEILGLAGLVGSGRTELLRLIYGLDPAQSGEVEVGGRRLPPGRPDLAIRAGLGFAPEERKSQGLWLDWSMVRNTSIADLARFRRGPFTDRASERQEATRHLRSLKTRPDAPERPARQFSGGNQQKAVLARWLLRSCRVLLLDEPTRGVDVGARSEIYRVIAELAGQRDRDRHGLQRAGRAPRLLPPRAGACARATSSTSSTAPPAPRSTSCGPRSPSTTPHKAG